MVAKGKGRAGSKPLSAAALQAESRESTTTDPTPALVGELEGQVSSEQLQALRKQVAEQEEYVRLLQRIKELEQEQSDLVSHTLRMLNEAAALQSSSI
jgi:gamma-glutamyl:cysteine ligase YbdK (ATP-grasp superfamily)